MPADTIQGIINEVAAVYHMPGWLPMTIAYKESGLNPTVDIVDTNGQHSTGLFQLNQAGLGAGHSIQELKDPKVNSKIAISAMAPYYEEGYAKGLRGVDLLDYVANNAGWPGTMGVAWTQEHDPQYDQTLNEDYYKIAGMYQDQSGTPVQPNVAQQLDVNGVSALMPDWLKNTPWYLILIVVMCAVLVIMLSYRLVAPK